MATNSNGTGSSIGNPGQLDWANIGVDRRFQDPKQAHEAQSGVYQDTALKISVEEKLPLRQMPQINKPTPFTIKNG